MPDDLHCRAASKLLSAACERTLTGDEQEALKRHLEECLMCRNFESQLRFLHTASTIYRTKD